jgi:transcriptional regulator with XRE-family HTH domain
MGHALPQLEGLNRELNIRSEAIERLPSSGDGTASGLLGLPQPVLSVSGGLEPRRLGTQSAASMLPERWLSVDAPGSKRPPPVAPGATDPAETVRVEAKGAPATELPATCRCLIVTFHHEGGLNGGRPPRELLQLLARLRSGFARNPRLEEARVRFSDGSVLFLHREEDGTLTESREHGPQAEALESFNAYPDTAVQRSEAVAAWQPRPLTTPLPEFLRELRRQSGLTQLQIAERIREITGEAKDYNAVSRYERNAEAGIPFRVLRALGDIYGVGIRTLIQISNQTRFPGIPAAQWTTRYHPIYLENSGDLDRIDYYRRADRRHESFGWTIYAARKNPFRYRTTVDLETETGLNANAFARLEQNANQPSLRAIRGLSAALNISERELIARANRTFHPELDLEALFPGKSIFLDPLAEDVRKVREYAAAPGSLGQTLFAYRKSLPDLPGAVEMSLRLDRHENYWGERELNRVSPDASNWRDWYDLFRKLDLPLDPIHPFLGPAARTEDSPAALFQEALTGETLSGFVARTGFDKKGLSLILGSRHREVQPETILDLQNALPGLNGARFYRALRPELLQFFPESGHNPPHLEVSREQIAEAMALHLGEALYAHRMANGIGLDALASQLGVSDATLKNYESISVQIENPEVLARAARILNLDPKVVYLHYHPQILRLFPIPPLQGRVYAPLGVAEYRYWTQERASIRDRGNMREALYQEANQVGISDPEALARRLGVSLPVAKKYWQKISILTVGEIQTLTRAFPGLSYRDWYEHFQAYALNYFLGRNLDGSVDYSLPEGWTLERLRGWDLRSAVRAAVDARFTSPREAAAATGVGFLARNENLVRGIKERSWTNDTIAQVARGLGMDRRLLFLYFRHPDLPPMRAMQP